MSLQCRTLLDKKSKSLLILGFLGPWLQMTGGLKKGAFDALLGIFLIIHGDLV